MNHTDNVHLQLSGELLAVLFFLLCSRTRRAQIFSVWEVDFTREAEARRLPLERFQMGVFQRSGLREDVHAFACLVISHCVHPNEAAGAGFQVLAGVVVSGGVELNWQPGGLY